MRGDAPGLSDHDVMRQRLENWGKWSRQDSCRPDPEAITAHIYDMGRTRDRDEEAAPEDLPVPIDGRDADNIDGYLCQLRTRSPAYFYRLRNYFYKRWPVNRMSLDEAIRALCDMEQDNHAVRDRMRGRA